MTIRINGKTEALDSASLTVTEILAVRNVPDPDMVSVQLNGDILEREEFETRSVREGDELEFLYFMGGGSPR